MKTITAIVTSALMIAGGIAQALPASASTTWDFANAPFTLSDGQGSTVAVTVQHMRVTGSSASGYVRVSDSAIGHARAFRRVPLRPPATIASARS